MAEAVSTIGSVAMENARSMLPRNFFQKLYFIYYLFLISTSTIYYVHKAINYLFDGLIFNILLHIFLYALLLPKVPRLARFLSQTPIRKYVWKGLIFLGSAITMALMSLAPTIFAPLIDFVKKIDDKVVPVRNNMPSGIRKPWLMVRRLLEWTSSVFIAPSQLAQETSISCHKCRQEDCSIVLMPCRHLCLCQDCNQELNLQETKECPICQTSVAYHKTVFIF